MEVSTLTKNKKRKTRKKKKYTKDNNEDIGKVEVTMRTFKNKR